MDLKAAIDARCMGERRVTTYPLGIDGMPALTVRSITAAERLAIERLGTEQSASIVALMMTLCNESGQLIYTARYEPSTRKIVYSDEEYKRLLEMDGQLFDALKTVVNGHCCLMESFDSIRERAKKNCEQGQADS